MENWPTIVWVLWSLSAGCGLAGLVYAKEKEDMGASLPYLLVSVVLILWAILVRL